MNKFLINLNNKVSAECKEDVPQTSGKGSEKQKRRKYFGFTTINENDT